MTRAELQSSLLRFETRYNARISDTLRPLVQSGSKRVRREAARLRLLNLAGAMNIALGPVVEENLLDMAAFLQLTRAVYRDYWIPQVFGNQGLPVLNAMNEASSELARVFAGYVSQAQLAEIESIVNDWHRRNPDVIMVESVRMADFSGEAAAKEEELEGQIAGLLAPVTRANIAADRALRMGERGLYLAQQTPFLVRMQATVGLQDALHELEAAVSDLSEGLPNSKEAELIVTQSEGLLRELRATLNETRQLADLSVKNPQLPDFMVKSLGKLAEILGTYHQIILEKKESGVLSAPGISGAVSIARTEIRNLFLAIFALSALVIAFAGAVYVVAKLVYERLSAKQSKRLDSSDQGKAA